MKYATTLLLALTIGNSFSQTTFLVDHFSDEYYGKIYISDTTQVFSSGWVAIFSKRSNRQLLNVKSEELALSFRDENTLANVKNSPYGEQSLIMYEDFNFDGKKDFALQDGQFSCYHGPSYKVYLATKRGFRLSNAFTKLAQNYCGMFYVDAGKKRISTMTKSGCCWHQFSEFTVENNRPKAVHIIEEDANLFPYFTHSEEIWDGKTMQRTVTKRIDFNQEQVKTLVSFVLPKENKRVVLFQVDSTFLHYALMNTDSTVHFAYPEEKVNAGETSDFSFDTRNNRLTFQHDNSSYTIYQTNNTVGIELLIGGKTYNWQGDTTTLLGKLEDVLTMKHENVARK